MGFVIAAAVIAVLWVAGELKGSGGQQKSSAAPPTATAELAAPAADAAPPRSAPRP
jgi:hypothetical protein